MSRPFARIIATLALVVVLGAALGGCSRCGFFWDDWKGKPNAFSLGACRSDAPVR
ncbi:MAG: peptidylprolyl isomerase [Pseudolabrys sp.]